MLNKLFGAFKPQKQAIKTPEIMGLRHNGSFTLDPLLLKLLNNELTTNNINNTQIIEAVGKVQLNTDTSIFRFYTDDEAFLQVITSGGETEQHIIDVKLMHFYSTVDVANTADWNDLLNNKIGNKNYQLNEHTYNRVWESTGDYHMPVPMTEKTYDVNGITSNTDQFTMLYERTVLEGRTETLFLSAEESLNCNNKIEHCFVISTGFSLGPSDITIIG